MQFVREHLNAWCQGLKLWKIWKMRLVAVGTAFNPIRKGGARRGRGWHDSSMATAINGSMDILPKELISNEIKASHSFVCENGQGELVGTFCYIEGIDPTLPKDL